MVIFFFHFQVVPNAIKEWEQALNVKRSQTPIFLNRKCRNSQYFSFDEDPGEQVCNVKCSLRINYDNY